MIAKTIGIVLMVIGIGKGVSVLLSLLVSAGVLAWYVLKVATMVAVVYIGYRLLRQRRLSAI